MQKLYGPDGRFNLADPDTQTMVNQGLQDPNKAPQFGVSLPELFALKQALDRISVKTQAPNQTVVDDLKNAAFAAIQTPNAMPPGQMPQQMPPQQMAQAPQGIPGLDSGVMENAQFAGGGIIAFADGKTVFNPDEDMEVEPEKFKGSKAEEKLREYAPLILEAAKKYNLDPALLAAQIHKESSFNPTVGKEEKHIGEYSKGLSQFLGSTAKQYGLITPEGKDLRTDPAASIEAMAHYMRDNLNKTGQDYKGALSIYNSGSPTAYKGKTQRGDTNEYVNTVLSHRNFFAPYFEAPQQPAGFAATPAGLATTPEGQAQYQTETSPEDIALGGAYAGGIAGAGAAGAALRGASSSVPRPGASIPPGTNFFVGPGGTAATELGARDMGTRGVPMVRPNTSLSTNVHDPAVNAAKSGATKTLNPPLTRDAAMRAGRMLDLAGRAGRWATGPGGLALGLGLHSSEAGAGSDIVPGREAPEGFMAGMQAGQTSERIQDILREYEADNEAFYAAQDEIDKLEAARKEELKTAEDKDRVKINREYKSLIEAATNKRDKIRDALKQKDEKTKRLPIVERYGDLGAARRDPDSPFKPQVSPTVKKAVSSVPGVAEAVAAQQAKYAEPGSYHGDFDSTSGTDLYTRSAEDLTGGKGEDKKEAAKPVAVAEDSDTVTKNNIDALKAQMKQAVNDRDIGYLFALAQAGFAMAASKSPYALQAIAEGAGMGVKAAQDITKDYIKRDDLLKRYQREEEREGAARRRNAKKDAETAAYNKTVLELRIREVNEGVKTKTYEGLLVGMVNRGLMTREQMLKELIAYNRSKKGPTIGESVQELRNLNKGSTATPSGASTSGEW